MDTFGASSCLPRGGRHTVNLVMAPSLHTAALSKEVWNPDQEAVFLPGDTGEVFTEEGHSSESFRMKRPFGGGTVFRQGARHLPRSGAVRGCSSVEGWLALCCCQSIKEGWEAKMCRLKRQCAVVRGLECTPWREGSPCSCFGSFS